MSVESNALAAVQAIPGLTPAEQQYLMTVAYGEGYYGQGWGSPSALTISESEVAMIDPMAGVGSHNWGAVQGTGPAGSFPHIDHHANHTPYVGNFKRYNSDTESAGDMAKILLKPNVRSALKAGDLHVAVVAQKANGYFEDTIEHYYAAVLRNYGILTSKLGWPTLLLPVPGQPTGSPPFSTWLAIVGTGVIIFFATLTAPRHARNQRK